MINHQKNFTHKMMDICDDKVSSPSKKPRILVGACACADTGKFGSLCSYFQEWAEVKAIVTKSSYPLIPYETIPNNVAIHGDEDELQGTWKISVEFALHTQLFKWADIMVIAPLSAKTLADIAGGLCDNLLTCIVRSWDVSKPLFVAPSMSTFMWTNPLTEQQCKSIKDDLGIIVINPASYSTPAQQHEYGSMSEPSAISATVRKYYYGNGQV